MKLQFQLALCLLASQSIGCFTQSYVSNANPIPDSCAVVFHLSDSTYVSSPSGKHHRVDEGYEVVGRVSTERGDQRSFEGIILDAELVGINVDRYNAAGTVGLIAGVALVLFLIVTRWGHDL